MSFYFLRGFVNNMSYFYYNSNIKKQLYKVRHIEIRNKGFHLVHND